MPVPPIKDEQTAHPVASVWRPALRRVVGAFVRGDFALDQGVTSVAAIPLDTANQIRDCIADYGETLVNLPDETWHSSVAQWMGSHWDVMVDLWTDESGRSDMVLDARVREVGSGFELTVQLVYVP